MIFNLALVTEMGPKELFKLGLSKFKKLRQGDSTVWNMKGRIGTVDCTDETMKYVLKYVRIKPKKSYIWDEDLMDGKFKFSRDIYECIELRNALRTKTVDEDRIFAATITRSTSHEMFFRAQAYGEQTLRKSVPKSCKEIDFIGLGDKTDVRNDD